VVNKPAVLLADEPTGNLDDALSEGILRLFEEFNRVGVTVLMAKGIFLTGNTGVSHSQAVLWLIVFWLGFGWVQSIVIAGVLTG
ncbi:hypothetical protein MJM28_31040, partial [Salmonella enterica subsp. enterica serovar Montevideo]|nr:hypothetical protein [Salmonella enterica subsp. enterica serovar Montevideo]